MYYILTVTRDSQHAGDEIEFVTLRHCMPVMSLRAWRASVTCENNTSNLLIMKKLCNSFLFFFFCLQL